jgi:hypothetical protein
MLVAKDSLHVRTIDGLQNLQYLVGKAVGTITKDTSLERVQQLLDVIAWSAEKLAKGEPCA